MLFRSEEDLRVALSESGDLAMHRRQQKRAVNRQKNVALLEWCSSEEMRRRERSIDTSSVLSQSRFSTSTFYKIKDIR